MLFPGMESAKERLHPEKLCAFAALREKFFI
jgi:hypothetical protein